MAGHPDKDIDEAVDYALDNDWRLIPVGKSSHNWGMLYCPERSREGHRQAVYSTPRNPRAHASDIRRAVDKCQHEPPEAGNEEGEDKS